MDDTILLDGDNIRGRGNPRSQTFSSSAAKREASAVLPPRAVTFSYAGVVLSSLVDAQAGRLGRVRTAHTVGRPGRTNNRHQRFALAA